MIKTQIKNMINKEILFNNMKEMANFLINKIIYNIMIKKEILYKMQIK